MATSATSDGSSMGLPSPSSTTSPLASFVVVPVVASPLMVAWNGSPLPSSITLPSTAARLRLDAGGVQGVAEGFVASHVDAASVERDGGRQALHEQDAAAHENSQHENGECDGERDARRALRRRGNGTRVRPRIRMHGAYVL